MPIDQESTLDSFSLLGVVEEHQYDPWTDWGKLCAFCKSATVSKSFDDKYLRHDFFRGLRVCYCERCGWWAYREGADTCNTPTTVYLCSILQSFDLRSARTPIEILELELPKWIERINMLNPRRMEDVIKRMLADVWHCEVRHMGYSRDGGTDLIILDGEKPIAVQVKRRVRKTHKEIVSCVREFLGAALLSDHRRLMYVTTAERFTRGAKDAANLAVKKHLVEAFELVSMREIRSFIPAMPNRNPWDFAVQRARDRTCPTVKVPNPYELTGVPMTEPGTR
jgi:hypothetical protein